MLPACSFHSQSAVSHRSTWELIHTREYILETMILKRHLHSRTCEVYVSVSTNFPWLINNQRMILYTESSLVFFFFWICQGAMFTFFRLNNSIKNSTWSGTGRRRHFNQKICRHESTYGLLQTASRCLSLPRASFSPHLKEDHVQSHTMYLRLKR